MAGVSPRRVADRSGTSQPAPRRDRPRAHRPATAGRAHHPILASGLRLLGTSPLWTCIAPHRPDTPHSCGSRQVVCRAGHWRHLQGRIQGRIQGRNFGCTCAERKIGQHARNNHNSCGIHCFTPRASMDVIECIITFTAPRRARVLAGLPACPRDGRPDHSVSISSSNYRDLFFDRRPYCRRLHRPERPRGTRREMLTNASISTNSQRESL